MIYIDSYIAKTSLISLIFSVFYFQCSEFIQRVIQIFEMILELFFLLTLLTKPVFLSTYSDFTTWGPICTAGTRQSPIDIISADLKGCQDRKFSIISYSGSILNQPDAAKGLQNSYPGGNIRSYDGSNGLLIFDSLQYHFHYLSQHKINGVQYDIQLHLVHSLNSLFQASDSLAVTGLLFQIDPSLTASDTDIVEQFKAAGANAGDNIDISTILSSQLAGKTFYNYLGSLTTPPCTQIVNWYVCSTIFKIKQSSYDSLKAAIDTGMSATTGNARPVQSINGRSLWNLDSSCNNDLSYANIVKQLKFEKRALISILIMLVIAILAA